MLPLVSYLFKYFDRHYIFRIEQPIKMQKEEQSKKLGNYYKKIRMLTFKVLK